MNKKFSYLVISVIFLAGLIAFSSSAAALDRAFKVGDPVVVTIDGLKVRATPAGSITGAVNVGMTGTITSGPKTSVLDGVSYTWWKIRYCGGLEGWSAQNWLAYFPSTIRVYRTATGKVETMGIRDYVKNVLPNEWISSWNPESLKAGAMAVKTYAWWRILHPRSANYDILDSTSDQVYKPGTAKTSTNQAVDGVWGTVMVKNNGIFMAQYIDGCRNWLAPTLGCTNTNYPGRMSQWGTQQLANQGKNYQRIISYYYGNIPVRQLTLC